MRTDYQIFKNGGVLFSGLSEHLFKCLDQIGLQINQLSGGEFFNETDKTAKKPRVLGKYVEGSLT